ncbi:MAG TPA: EsaB/YukD family protein [Ktedonobacteraceae bacterium]|nr:EsaB/YukD family protein [Ktedonobacteraceae bacterium]
MQKTLLVTVQGTQRELDIELPGDVLVSELLPLLLQMCGAPTSTRERSTIRWNISISDTGKTLQARRTLLENNVLNGDLLLLQKAQSAAIGSQRPEQEKRQDANAPRRQSASIGVSWEKYPFA